jgi:sugar lactone lactonase YvrE
VITVLSPDRHRLGEGPLWDPRTRTLHWVDIVAGDVFSQPEDARVPRFTRLGVQVGCLGLTADPNILVAGLRTGWHLVNLETGWRQLLGAPEHDRETCRFNDGSVDPAGRFWTGSLEDSESGPDGRLYRLDPDGSYRTMDEGFYCSNGIDWSPDGRWMYFVDSRQDRIYRYAFDPTHGEVRDREILVDTTAPPGIPDGLRVDAAGDIWCAFWDGAHITRFAPDGTIQERLASRPTVGIEDILDRPLIGNPPGSEEDGGGFDLRHMLGEHATRADIAYLTDHPTTLVALVRSAFGIGVISQLALYTTSTEGLAVRPIESATAHREVALFWTRRRSGNAAVCAFLHAQEQAPLPPGVRPLPQQTRPA